jgi:hypothetical protein
MPLTADPLASLIDTAFVSQLGSVEIVAWRCGAPVL